MLLADYALCARAEADALDSRRRGNDDHEVFLDSQFTPKKSLVVPGKRSATRIQKSVLLWLDNSSQLSYSWNLKPLFPFRPRRRTESGDGGGRGR
ncbi:hypothetical protein XM38_025340 [Halomicronema hongdechloris C2206]|uniref:Uncharacterized protein n=1 Tax=Halomicronema hongdechloris C2206 TaxID=1641165 RepID=A0A1Z3HMQ3_9CYAN|nr:hypothetical protein XM38_025340 [Halomicronema hongdechloris C2206]